MRSYSQAGQDLWIAGLLPVVERFPRGPWRTFLDVGCNDPEKWSNTALLEELGWHGWGIDVSLDLGAWHAKRPATNVLERDATMFDYREIIPGGEVDYLSLDIDQASLTALRRILECGISFQVATVEHDAYRFGDELRAGQRELLIGAGYHLKRADVHADGHPDFPFEDWWVRP